MKNDWKQRKGFFLVLLVTAVAVWGLNIYQITAGLSGQAEVFAPAVSGSRAERPAPVPFASLYTYRGDFRDPFEAPRSASAARDDEYEAYQPAEPDPYYRPALRLTGIIGSLAMVQTPEGYTNFMSVGDDFDDVTLESLGPAEATFVHAGQSFTLKLH